MEYAERLSGSDELMFQSNIDAIFYAPSLEEKDKLQNEEIEESRQICWSTRKTIGSLRYPQNSSKGKALKEFIVAMESKSRYKLNLDTLIAPTDYFILSMPDVGLDEDEAGTTSACYAYSVARYIWSHYIEDASTENHKKSSDFFLEQLTNTEKLLKKDFNSPLGKIWFDMFWIFYKKTYALLQSPDHIKVNIDLHNRFWTNRIKPRKTSLTGDPLFLYENELPADFINDEIDSIIRKVFPTWKSTYGNHPEFYKSIIDTLNFANDNESCLIFGETGTGKESIARLIHAASNKPPELFVAVNCSGITDSLFNSEISGLGKGAATGTKAHLGAFLKASGYTMNGETFVAPSKEGGNISSKDYCSEGGTIFLDELNSLPLTHQAKLLRIIQEKEVQPVGHDKALPIKVKVVCAANKDILKQCSAKTFREDLYYRISRGIIRVPSLREMPDSIPDIALGKIEELNAKRFASGKVAFSDKALEKLKNYDWPGNIRELENVVYRAFKQIVIESEGMIESEHIQFLERATEIEKDLRARGTSSENSTEGQQEIAKNEEGTSPHDEVPFNEAVEKFEKAYLEEALKKAGGKKSQTSKNIDIGRDRLNRKIKQYGIDIQSFKCP